MRNASILALAALLASCEGEGGVNQLNPADVFSPATLGFGPRTIGVTHELTTTLVVREPLTVTQVRFESGSEVFAAKTRTGVLRGTALRPNTPLDVVVQFKPLAESTYDTAMVVVFADGRTVTLELTAAGRRASTTSEVEVTPSTIVFPETEVDRDVTIEVEVENRSTELQTLRSVADGLGQPVNSGSTFYITPVGETGTAMPLILPPGAKVRLDLHFRPRTAGPASGELHFFAQGFDTAPADIITAQGVGITAGELTCTPLRLEFGDLVRGRSAESTASCSVAGGVYTIKRIALAASASPRFTLVSAPGDGTVITPGGRFDVRARFTADGMAGDFRGDIELTSGLDQTRVVSLAGTVVRPPLADVAIAASLSWDAGVDLDLHLVRGGAAPFDPTNDCFFQRKTQRWGQLDWGGDDPVLDVDSIGFGPEELTLQTPNDRLYDLYVHNYRGAEATNATVVFRVFGTEVGRMTQALTRCGDMWHVGRIDVSGGSPVFSQTGGISDQRARGECP